MQYCLVEGDSVVRAQRVYTPAWIIVSTAGWSFVHLHDGHQKQDRGQAQTLGRRPKGPPKDGQGSGEHGPGTGHVVAPWLLLYI